jgi:Flp pilus assembly pilin Flp
MLRKTFARLMGDERGVTLVEYGIGITLAVIVGTVALTQLGFAIDNEMAGAQVIMESNDATTLTATTTVGSATSSFRDQ